MLKHLSPTSISLYLEDLDKFYLKYVSPNRPDRELQTEPMSVGSSFDSHVKAYLRSALNAESEFNTLFKEYFESSVETQNRDFALDAGRECFDAYRRSGALSDLLLQMETAAEGPRFEFTVSSDGDVVTKEGSDEGYQRCQCGAEHSEHDVDGRCDSRNCSMYNPIPGLRLLGKPDAWFVNKQGSRIILDWKVNGYCSTASPAKGFVRIRSGKGITRGDDLPHKDAVILVHRGVAIDSAMPMEVKDASWARQLAVYAWLCGEPVGGEIVGFIDQLVCAPGKIRVAEHRALIGVSFQEKLYALANEIWDVVHSGWIFRDMSLEESVKRCEALDSVAAARRDPKRCW